MELIDIILKRRSVRKYTEEAIPDDKLQKILQAGLLAPTSRNRKPCEFHVVKDRSVIEELSKAKKMGGSFLAGAAVAIVVLADEEKADTWVEDSSIAMAHMCLMASEQGVGCCWVQIHMRTASDGTDAEENVRRILGKSGNLRCVGILSLGIPAEEAEPHRLEEADFSKVSGDSRFQE